MKKRYIEPENFKKECTDKENGKENIEEINKEDIKTAVERLNKEGVIIFPTDTVYGIGSLPNKNSVKKIYEIKKRDFSKKIIALVDKYERIFDLVAEKKEDMEKIHETLKYFWPGELTVIFKARKDFTEKFDEDMPTIGIRIPKNETALEIIKNAGGVVLTTSANISGNEDTSRLEKIDRELIENVDFVLKEKAEGNLTGTPSTVVEYKNGDFYMLRKGNITLRDIKKRHNRQD